MIDPRTAPGWRQLQFRTIDDALADAATLVAAARTDTLRSIGNWTLGQAFGHVAAWAAYPYEGYPMRPPWFVRLFGRLLKRRLLGGRLPRGYRLPGVEGGTFATEVLSTEEGHARLQRAFERLRVTAPSMPNPVFGRLSHGEWITLNLGHAALHQGYFRAE